MGMGRDGRAKLRAGKMRWDGMMGGFQVEGSDPMDGEFVVDDDDDGTK